MLSKEIGDKLKDMFAQYNREDCNSYTCWDCEKDLGDLNFDLEAKKRLPLTIDGKLSVLCSACFNKDEDDY